jgi:hypothetical protein
MKEVPHICKTCRHAQWEPRKDGKPNTRKAGKCVWPVPANGVQVPRIHQQTVLREVKWPRWVEWIDTEPCNVWEPKE